MTYSESESDFNIAINSVSGFDSTTSESGPESGSESESDFSSVFTNLEFFFFSPYIYTLLNELADVFFINSHNKINSILFRIFFLCFLQDFLLIKPVITHFYKFICQLIKKIFFFLIHNFNAIRSA